MKVRMKLGAEGYGIFFMLIERLREEEGYKSTIDYNTLAFDLRVDAEKVKQVVEDYDLFKFTEDGKYFYSDSFNERMEMMDVRAQQRKSKAKKAAEARWNKQSEDTSNTQALLEQCSSNAQAMLNHANKIKLNKIKLNKTKLNKNKPVTSSGGSPNNDVQELINVYQENFGVANSIVQLELKEKLDVYGKEMILESFKRTIGKDKPFQYMRGIWEKWKDNGITTIEQAKQFKTNNKKYYNKPSGYVEIVPDWVK
jgi:putative replication initiation protein